MSKLCRTKRVEPLLFNSRQDEGVKEKKKTEARIGTIARFEHEQKQNAGAETDNESAPGSNVGHAKEKPRGPMGARSESHVTPLLLSVSCLWRSDRKCRPAGPLCRFMYNAVVCLASAAHDGTDPFFHSYLFVYYFSFFLLFRLVGLYIENAYRYNTHTHNKISFSLIRF